MAVAVITGGSSGIGAAFAERLANEGYDLVLVARDRSRLETTAVSVRARYGVRVEPLVADLATAAGRNLVETRLTNPAAPVEMLVNNVGVEVPEEFTAAPLSALQREVDVNITTTLRLTHAALGGMLTRGRGSVIVVASFAGFLPRAGSAYGASKAWAIAFVDTLAASLRGTGVSIGVLTPGYVRTRRVSGIGADAAFRHRCLIADADRVVSAALAAQRRGRVVCAPGPVYRGLVGFLELPRRSLRLAARLAGCGAAPPRR